MLQAVMRARKGVGREADEIDLVIDKTGAMDYKSLFSGGVSNGETYRFSGWIVFRRPI